MLNSDRIGVSIVLFRPHLESLNQTVLALKQQTWPKMEVHISINGGGPGGSLLERTLDEFSSDAIRITSESRFDNLGFSGAHNRTLAEMFARGFNAVVVLNPDLALERNAIERLAIADAAMQHKALLGPVLMLTSRDRWEDASLVDSLGIEWTQSARHVDAGQGRPKPIDLARHPWRVEGLTGACVWVGRRAYERIVGISTEFFDEAFVAYREDAELGLRASLCGVPCMIVPEAVGSHARYVRNAGRKSPLPNLLSVQGRFLIAFKYGRRRPGSSTRALARDAVVTLACLTIERESFAGLRRAIAVRRYMRRKGRYVRREAEASVESHEWPTACFKRVL